jgi:hypothetical protein
MCSVGMSVNVPACDAGAPFVRGTYRAYSSHYVLSTSQDTAANHSLNISLLQVLSDGEVEVQLETRFPIFGGWKTQFHLGYSVPTENALTRSEDRYHLKVDFFAPFDNVWVEDLELKVRTWGCCVGCA